MIPKTIEKKQQKRQQRNNGFTLIETLISLLIVALVLITIAKITTSTAEASLRSRYWTSLLQAIENRQDILNSRPFASPGLADGQYHEKGRNLKTEWNIESLSDSLKKIRLTVSVITGKYKVIKKQIYFYKSKYINNY